jgi:hypothetical protein
VAKTAAAKKAVTAGVQKIKGLLGFEPEELATRYPQVAPPTPAVDPKTGREFLQKTPSAEAEAVAKVRKQAQKDIEAGRYDPYFPVNQRVYADPSKYSLSGRTLTDARPKREDTIAKYQGMADTPEARANLTGAYQRAEGDALAHDWYAMGQLEKAYIDELGPERGRERFRTDFAEAMAATTGGADPTSNLLMSYFGNFQRGQGLPIPGAAYDMPFPIGGRYASGNMAQYDKMIGQGQGISASANPKRFNFAADFMGHQDLATLDEQMSGLYVPGLLAPPPGSYGVFQDVLNDVAAKQGVTPVNFQEVAWAGAKGTQGKPMIQHVNEAIERTSRVTGMPQDQVVRGFINRRTPMYGIGGGALGTGLLGEEEQPLY